MKRVSIIGCPGSGKSTLARAMHEKIGLPLFHLDMMYWNADKTKVEREVFLARLAEAMAGEAWIIDGNYGATMEARLAACDTVIFLDYPAEVCLAGVKARSGKPRSDMPWFETEEDERFSEFIRSFEERERPKILAYLEKYADKQILHFRTREEAEAFLCRLNR